MRQSLTIFEGRERTSKLLEGSLGMCSNYLRQPSEIMSRPLLGLMPSILVASKLRIVGYRQIIEGGEKESRVFSSRQCNICRRSKPALEDIYGSNYSRITSILAPKI